MHDHLTRTFLVLFAFAMIGILGTELGTEKATVRTPAIAPDPNPLLAAWAGRYGRVPPFDRVKLADFKPALEAAMDENLAELDKIAKNSAAPTFENAIVAIERAGHALDRVSTIYNVWGSTMASLEFQ